MHFDGRDYYFIEQSGYDPAWIPNIDWVMGVLKRLAGCSIELHVGLGDCCIILKRKDETVYLHDDPMADAIILTTPKAGQLAQLFWEVHGLLEAELAKL